MAVERTIEETTAEIDAIATSINMMPLVDPTFTGFIPGEPMFEGESVTAACKRQPTVVSSSTSPFFTVQPPCDKDLNYIMDDLYKEHKWGSIDSDDSNGDYDDMPECINDNSASSGDDEHTARHSIARKKKLVLQVSGAKQVCISSAGDDNESMGKLFVSNLKTATSKLSESTNTYALRLAENAAELKIAMLRTCTKYAKYLDESTACNAEPRIEHLMEQINLATDGNAATYVANAFNAKKAKYTALQWQDMADQRLAWLKKTRPRDYVTIANKCCDAHASATPSAASPPNSTKVTPLCTDNVAAAKLLLTATGPTKCCNVVTHLLTKDCDAATKHAILSMVKAPPTTIGMGRPVALTGLEILWRLHVVLGHASIDQVMATLSKTDGMRAGVVTKSDVEAFVKLGCAQCIVWKMRRAPVRSLTDSTLAPPGKKWSYDTLTLKVKTAAGNLYITRFLDNGSGKKRSYGHKDFTAPTLEMILSLMRAWVRPVHGEIWIGRRDGHPSQRAKSFQDALSDAQIHDESTAPYQHESMPVGRVCAPPRADRMPIFGGSSRAEILFSGPEIWT